VLEEVGIVVLRRFDESLELGWPCPLPQPTRVANPARQHAWENSHSHSGSHVGSPRS
jgi:hypothetical protein